MNAIYYGAFEKKKQKKIKKTKKTTIYFNQKVAIVRIFIVSLNVWMKVYTHISMVWD